MPFTCCAGQFGAGLRIDAPTWMALPAAVDMLKLR